MTKREIIGSALGLIITVGVTVFVMYFIFPPSHPNFAPMVATIVVASFSLKWAGISGFTEGDKETITSNPRGIAR